MHMTKSVDWLTFTIPYDFNQYENPTSQYSADNILNHIASDNYILSLTPWHKVEKKERFYHYFYKNKLGWEIALSESRLQGVRLVFSGSTLPVGQGDQKRIYNYFKSQNWRSTRVDVCFDVLHAPYDIEYLWKNGLEKQMFERRNKSDLILNPNGDTIAIGSRKSDKYLRIYDKGKEQKRTFEWIRWELEVKYKTAHALPDSYDELLMRGAGTVRAMVDSIPAPIDRGLERIQSNTEPYTKPPIKTRTNREIWLMEQVLPALVKTSNENPALFDRFVEKLASMVK